MFPLRKRERYIVKTMVTLFMCNGHSHIGCVNVLCLICQFDTVFSGNVHYHSTQ